MEGFTESDITKLILFSLSYILYSVLNLQIIIYPTAICKILAIRLLQQSIVIFCQFHICWNNFLAYICSFSKSFKKPVKASLNDFQKLGLGITESRISSFTKCVFTQIVFRPIHEECIKHISICSIIIQFCGNANKNAKVIDNAKAPIRIVNPPSYD
jgi:hypothetical protein